LCDNIEDSKGHYIKFEFDNNGLIKEVVYMGSEEISVPSLTNLIGLSETYLNRLIERSAHGEPGKENLIENLTEFLSENWAMALYHEWFSEFRHNLKQKLSSEKEVEGLLEKVEELVRNKGFMDRQSFREMSKTVSEQIKTLIRVIIESFLHFF
jgi:Rad3-related DNA helicase